MTENLELDLAWSFVQKTDRNIFLTGKAGTGKTTFLRRIKNESLKRLVVVAPTGVAAINAKGVTIHSFFQMPFGPVLPGAFDNNTQRKFNKRKIDIIRSLDLVIIDEISMVRADLLDGIDQVLRRYKNRNKVFGGVQILMIGDLQQLAPVVRNEEWDLLKSHYQTPYFFSSKAFQESKSISVELKHIYRQDNKEFIKILNEIRNNNLSKVSEERLNKRFLPNFSPKEDAGYITLTTHNNRAERMNEKALAKIDKKSYFYKAQVKGKFSEYAYPTHAELELKIGAQVMFIKNDSAPEKRYFNGKIGKITSINKEEVSVLCPNDDQEIVVTPEVWDNITYSIDQQTKAIKEERIGSFSQIPLKLAWAITIHKSQGLTFEKAIIDAQASFAHGQTYVALSRCRTLEGVVLKSPINSSSIINDEQVKSFTDSVQANKPTQEMLILSQISFQLNLIEELFDFYAFLFPVTRLIDIYYKNSISIKGNIIDPLEIIKDKGIIPLVKVSTGFKKQLQEMCKTELPEKDKAVQERFIKGVHYFLSQVEEVIRTPFENLSFTTENKTIKADIQKQLDYFEEKLNEKLFALRAMTDRFEVSKYLEVRALAVLQKTKEKKKRKAYTETTEHPKLFEELRTYRTIVSQAEDIPPFQVFTQLTLFELCEKFPTTTQQLRAIHGMGKIRVTKYGDEIIKIIKSYVNEHDIEVEEVAIKKAKNQVGSSKHLTLEMFKKGKTIEEIAKERGLVKGTIETHLIQFMKTGEITALDLISEKRYKALENLISNTTYKGLGDLKKKIGNKGTYTELQIMLNTLKS